MKIKKFLAVLLVVIVTVSVFAGCDVITKNEDRDYHQSLATISYKGLTDTVTKGEFISSFNSLAYYYVTYYGYTIEKAADFIFDSMAQRKLLLLYVRDYYATQKGLENTVSIDKLLNDVEKNEAVKSANETMQSSYDTTFKEMWDEYLAVNEDAFYEKYPERAPEGWGDKEDDKEEKPEEKPAEKVDTPRPTRPDKAKDQVDFDGPLSAEDKATPFFDEENHYKEEFTQEEKVVSDKAVNQLKDNLQKNYVSYEYYLKSGYESQLLAKFQRDKGADFTKTSAVNLITEKYNEYVTLNTELFSNNTEANYKSALANLANLVYHPESEQGYGYVLNILLKFSPEQEAKLKAFKDENTDKDAINAYRELLAKEIKVNVTNPYYDPEFKDCTLCTDDDKTTECENQFCPAKMYGRKDVKATDILAEMNAIFADIDSGNLDNANTKLQVLGKKDDTYFLQLKDIDGKAGLTDYEKFKLKKEVAEVYVYLVNDDPGMYNKEKGNEIAGNGLGYLITPDGKDSDYVEEFTNLGRTLVTQGLGASNYCTTDFGYHFMFVTYKPYGETFDADGNKVTGVQDNKLNNDYIIHYGRYDDENDKDKTLADTIFDALKDAFTQKQYSIDAEKAINDNKDNSISINQKLWDKLMKEFDKQLNRR